MGFAESTVVKGDARYVDSGRCGEWLLPDDHLAKFDAKAAIVRKMITQTVTVSDIMLRAPWTARIRSLDVTRHGIAATIFEEYNLDGLQELALTFDEGAPVQSHSIYNGFRTKMGNILRLHIRNMHAQTPIRINTHVGSVVVLENCAFPNTVSISGAHSVFLLKETIIGTLMYKDATLIRFSGGSVVTREIRPSPTASAPYTDLYHPRRTTLNKGVKGRILYSDNVEAVRDLRRFETVIVTGGDMPEQGTAFPRLVIATTLKNRYDPDPYPVANLDVHVDCTNLPTMAAGTLSLYTARGYRELTGAATHLRLYVPAHHFDRAWLAAIKRPNNVFSVKTITVVLGNPSASLCVQSARDTVGTWPPNIDYSLATYLRKGEQRAVTGYGVYKVIDGTGEHISFPTQYAQRAYIRGPATVDAAD